MTVDSGDTIGVVGGGAAGIMASLGIAEAGGRAVLYERNEQIGIKIRISGGGKCNITHEATPRELEEGFIPKEARFLRYAFNEMPPEEILRRLHNEGLETYTRPNGRVFPVSGRSKDVLAAFERMLRKSGVTVRTDALVAGVEIHDGRAVGVKLGDSVLPHSAVIVTTGGESYRKVGTTGDGMRWAREMGHTMVPIRGALAPIQFPTAPPKDWQGIALRDVVLSLRFSPGDRFPKKEKIPTSWRDDLLLTHNGISGPTALEVSRAAALAREYGETVELVVDLLPDDTAEDLRDAFLAFVTESPKSDVSRFVDRIAPSRLVPYLLKSASIDPGRKAADLSKGERGRLLETIKAWVPGVVGGVPIDRGEVTAGGVALNQVSRTTMESKSVSGLYISGEALDISGCVGGYNLQAAFATGYVAGRDAAARYGPKS